MAADATTGLSLQDLQRTISEIGAEREEIAKERKIYRRLGFSTERLNLRQRQLEARLAACEVAMKRLRTSARDSGGFLASAPALGRQE